MWIILLHSFKVCSLCFCKKVKKTVTPNSGRNTRSCKHFIRSKFVVGGKVVWKISAELYRLNVGSTDWSDVWCHWLAFCDLPRLNYRRVWVQNRWVKLILAVVWKWISKLWHWRHFAMSQDSNYNFKLLATITHSCTK